MKAVPVWHSAAPEAIYLCRRFELPVPDADEEFDFEAWMYCASNGVYEVCVNGKTAARGFGTALTDLPVWNKCDLRDHLRPGQNTIVARVSGGSPCGFAPWFMADGAIRTSSQSTLELTTGDTWATHGVGMLEFFRSSPIPWHSVVPAEGAWDLPSAVEGGGPEPVLWSPPEIVEEETLACEVVAFGEVDVNESLQSVEPGPFTTCKCLNREGLLSPGKRDTVMRAGPPDRAVCIILDFGRPLTGMPRLRLKAGAAATIELGFSLDLPAVHTTINYVSAGGREDWIGLHPQYGRYLIIRVGNAFEDVRIDCASMIERRAAIEADNTGEFSIPEGLAAIWRVGQRSLATRTEVYRRYARARNWLLEHTLALCDYYAEGGGSRASAVLQSSRAPGLADKDPVPLLAHLLFVDAHAWHHGAGDARQAAAAATLALGVIDDLRPLCRADELLDTGTAESGFSALNALYGGALAAVDRLCQLAGDKRGAARARQMRIGVKSGLQTVWNDGRGLYADGAGAEERFSQWTNGLMLYFDLVESGRRRELLRGLRGSDVARPDDLLQAFFLVGGLWKTGEQASALTQVEHNWGRVADRIGGTWSEKWDRGSGDEVPGPGYFLGSEVLGIRPASPGYETVEVAPQHAGMDRAEGTVPTCRGTIQVAWDVGESFHIRMTRSQIGRTNVRVPRRGQRFPTVTVNGEPVWRNEKFHPNSVARQVVSGEEEIVIVTEGCGPYDIEAG